MNKKEQTSEDLLSLNTDTENSSIQADLINSDSNNHEKLHKDIDIQKINESSISQKNSDTQKDTINEIVKNGVKSEFIQEDSENTVQTDIDKDTNNNSKLKKENFRPYNPENQKNGLDKLAIAGICIVVFSVIVILLTLFYFYANSQKETIYSGITIKGIDVSNLSKEQAIVKVSDELNSKIPTELVLQHNDYTATISTSDLNIDFHVNEAVNNAYNICRSGNIFEKNFNIFKLNFSNINIDPYFSLDNNQLQQKLNDISENLPDKLVESSYYIEKNNLIINKGKEGLKIDAEEMLGIIQNEIYNLDFGGGPIQIVTSITYPSEINLEAIHQEIYKEAKDAYYTKNPYKVHASENGLDFKISMEDAQTLLQNAQDICTIPLKVTYPKVTTSMVGSEAFPDLLSTFSTYYNASQTNRTTNLRLAANKINGFVLMPGETFSYNKVVGNRTAAAGYKPAGTYVNGKVVDGIGGGICQITTTLYNAVLYANLDIVQRSNHQFIPSYSSASRDATVVYGAIDFQFKNNRAYPIKIYYSVSGGVAKCNIFGVKTDNDYEVQLSSRITSTTADAIYSEAYKTLKKNGTVISTTLLSKDKYLRH